MHFQESVRQKGGHAAVLPVRLSRIRLSQATNKNRIYTSDCLKSILFSFAIKYNEEICTWEMGKPQQRTAFLQTPETGNCSCVSFVFCIILLYTQVSKCVCSVSPFFCCFSLDEMEKPKQRMLSGSSGFLALSACSQEDVKRCYLSANTVRSENPRT